MATVDEIAMLRRMTDVARDDTTYTDDVLAGIIDASSSIEGAAAQVWTEKAAAFADQVDMSESGSSRSLSQLQRHALEMRDKLASASIPTGPRSGASFTVQVERP